MKKIIILIAGAISLLGNAQAPKFQWAKNMGGTSVSVGHAIAIDASGNTYTTGRFDRTTDFNPDAGVFDLSAANPGYDDIFISKLNSSGGFVWAKRIGGSLEDRGSSIVTDPTGNIYISGSFRLTVDFDPNAGIYNLTSSAGSEDIFILKLDTSGNFIWARRLGGSKTDLGFSIAVDKTGNIYTTGEFMGIADFDPDTSVTYNLTATGLDYDIFISKLDPSGNFAWAKRIGGSGPEVGNSIVTDTIGNIYSTGYFYGTVDFDPNGGVSNLNSTSGSIYILKLDANGNLAWVKNMGGNSVAAGNSITIDNSGNIYSTGYFKDTADFDPNGSTFNLISRGDLDIFISKLDAFGNFVWAKKIGGPNTDIAYSIGVDANGNVFTTGYFQDTVDFDPNTEKENLIAANFLDIFILKLYSNGNYSWANNIGAYGRGIALVVDKSGNVSSTGEFTGTGDFDLSSKTFYITSIGHDVYMSKMNACQPDNSVTQTGTILTANVSGLLYQWVNCPSYTLIPGAISKSYNASINGDYAVIVSQNGCRDTSNCYNIKGIGINKQFFATNIQIFPNPTSGKILVNCLNLAKIERIEVFNGLGVLIYAHTHLSNNIAIDLTECQNGIYYIKVADDDGKSGYGKLIKTR